MTNTNIMLYIEVFYNNKVETNINIMQYIAVYYNKKV